MTTAVNGHPLPSSFANEDDCNYFAYHSNFIAAWSARDGFSAHDCHDGAENSYGYIACHCCSWDDHWNQGSSCSAPSAQDSMHDSALPPRSSRLSLENGTPQNESLARVKTEQWDHRNELRHESTPANSAPATPQRDSPHRTDRLAQTPIKREEGSPGTASELTPSSLSPTSIRSCKSRCSAASTPEYTDEEQQIWLHRKKRSFTTEETAVFRCDLCRRPFQRQHNLKAHMAVHDPQRRRPWLCEFSDCEQTFVRQTDLRRHINCVHTREEVFACPYCRTEFTRRDTGRRHAERGCPNRPNEMIDCSRTEKKIKDEKDDQSWSWRGP